MAKLTRATLKQFPEVMFIAKKSERDGSYWYSAQKQAADCIEDDGPEIVAHYRLAGVYELRKTVRTTHSIEAKNGRK